jgi:phosphoglycolate phosphatase-like HAD superfamily hydrolase
VIINHYIPLFLNKKGDKIVNQDRLSINNFVKKKDFLVGIDSDGSAFDTMEIKHKECFVPNFIYIWELQPIAKYAREVWEKVNLYSKWRGINRFAGLVMVLDLLSEKEEVKKRGFTIQDISSLREWVEKENTLSNSALEARLASGYDSTLEKALLWSKAVNNDTNKIVKGVPPFNCVKECMARMVESCDIAVISAASGEALYKEWTEHALIQYTNVVAGQEVGGKKEQLRAMKEKGYEEGNILMIGDAIGDLKAARDNNVKFYPINPGREEESWERFYKEAYDKFLKGEYTAEYENKLIEEFRTYLI